MVRISILFITVLLLSGCSYSSPYRLTKQNELIQDEYISIRVVDGSWEIDKEYNGYTWVHGLPVLSKTTNNFTFKIDFRTYPYNKNDVVDRQMFNPKAIYPDSDKTMRHISKLSKSMGVIYERDWMVYVKHMRCAGGVYSKSYGGDIYSATSKNYFITCGYYDKNYGKRLLDIDYRYYGGMGDTELQGEKDNKSSRGFTPKEAETYLKASLKSIIQTLKIKHFDKEKMIQEGLCHPKRQFESTKW